MFDRRHFLIFSTAALAGCAAATGPRGTVRLAPGTTLIVLRHADREANDLTEWGRRRAVALLPALSDLEIDAIYSSDLQRNIDTATPLATARGLPIETVADTGTLAAFLAREGAGRTVVWVGNLSNLDPLWADLGAPGPAPVEYGDLFILRPGTPPVVERRQFRP